MQVIENKDIIQSYLLTIARYDANIYEKRILTHIVEANQDYLMGQRFQGGVVINIEEDLFKEREYTIDVRNILFDEKDNNYNRVISAFHSLQEKFIRFDDEDNNHISVPFITGLIVKRHSGIARFRMSELVYKAFTDFTKGFRKLELKLTLSFKSVYTIRLYELISGKKEPITYTIDNLKRMFHLENKYNQVSDFIKRVIDPAQSELDGKSPYTFDYTINKNGRKYHSITFFPVYQPKYRDEELERKSLQKQVSLGWTVGRETKKYLMEYYGFSNRELKNNQELLERASKEIDLLGLLRSIAPRANRTDNIKGYVIGAIKKEYLKEKNITG